MAKRNKATQAEGPQPMDPDAPETSAPAEGSPFQSRERTAGALVALIEEVTELFPEVTYEKGNPEAWRVISRVTFEVGEVEGLVSLLNLLLADTRVMALTIDSQENLVEVALKHSFRTMDIRDSFGLAEAWMILIEEDES